MILHTGNIVSKWSRKQTREWVPSDNHSLQSKSVGPMIPVRHNHQPTRREILTGITSSGLHYACNQILTFTLFLLLDQGAGAGFLLSKGTSGKKRAKVNQLLWGAQIMPAERRKRPSSRGRDSSSDASRCAMVTHQMNSRSDVTRIRPQRVREEIW